MFSTPKVKYSALFSRLKSAFFITQKDIKAVGLDPKLYNPSKISYLLLTEDWFAILENLKGSDNRIHYLLTCLFCLCFRLLEAPAVNKILQFHPKCHRIHLTHMYFIENFLVFFQENTGFDDWGSKYSIPNLFALWPSS